MKILACEECGKTFTPPHSRKQPCCSKECGYKLRSKRCSGANGHRWKGGKQGALERFWLSVQIRTDSECWEWQGTRDKNGYGRIRLSKEQRRERAYRVAYTLAKGEIPKGLVVRHTCDNPPCCNPNHLILGTKAENFRDMFDRKRNSNGALKKKRGGELDKARAIATELRPLVGYLPE